MKALIPAQLLIAIAGCAHPVPSSSRVPPAASGGKARVEAGPTALPAPAAARSPAATIDPEIHLVLDELAALGGKPIETLSAEQARRQPTPADAVKALLRKQERSAAPLPVANVERRSVKGPGGEIPIRIYTPAGNGPFPIVLYAHGGGWVIGDLDAYDASARSLANAAQAVVVSTHYRRAPEHPFPASHDDVFAVYAWTRDNAMFLQGDPQRVAVAGESAGGNMAAGVCITARDRGTPLPAHLLLICPVAGMHGDLVSYHEHAGARPLNRAMMEWFFRHELPTLEAQHDPRINLLDTDLRNLPPATVITAEIDPLRSEGQMLAEKLRSAGVEVVHRNYDGATHEFFGMAAVAGIARDAVSFAGSRLRQAFRGGEAPDKPALEAPARP